jgi:hypothetical protein
MRLNDWAMTAWSLAIRTSQASARFAPPPAATPLIAPITGFADRRIVITTRRPASTSAAIAVVSCFSTSSAM